MLLGTIEFSVTNECELLFYHPSLQATVDEIRGALPQIHTGVSIAEGGADGDPLLADWMAPEAKPRLAAFGIAPPHLRAPRIDVTGISPLRRQEVVVPCPRCASPRTRLVSQFGSTACKAQYRCDACLEPFDYFKPH